MGARCRLCGGETFEPVLDLGRLPVAHRVLRSRDEEEELFPFALHACASCGLTQVLAPIDPALLYGRYNFNFSSWKPEPHLPAEIDEIRAFGTVRSAIDVGCNDGLFLDRLRAAGVERVAGIEPNPHSGALARERGIRVYGEMIGEALCDRIVAECGRFDLVVTRQVIEHLTDLRTFFTCVDRLLSPTGFAFFDIPDFGPAAGMGDCSVLWEEHVNYFTPATFARALEANGFAIARRMHYDFSGGTLAVVAQRAPAKAPPADPAAVEEALEFGRLVQRYRTRAMETLRRARDGGNALVVYGTGVRSCMLLNGLRLGEYFDYALDDQAERQGLFMPGSRLPIRPSDDLRGEERHVVCLLAVNHENEAKVVGRASGLPKAGATFFSGCVPNDVWAELARV